MYQNFGYPFNNNFSMPTATQPYGYPMQPQMQQPPQQQPAQQNNTNIVYVNGIDDVRSRQLPANSNFVFLDNDNPIIYRKTVDGQGRMAVEVFDIVPHKETPTVQPDYALKSDIKTLQEEVAKLRAEVNKRDRTTVASTVGTTNS